MNDINKSKLKETNYESFKQIHIDDKEKSIEDYEHISSNSTEIMIGNALIINNIYGQHKYIIEEP